MNGALYWFMMKTGWKSLLGYTGGSILLVASFVALFPTMADSNQLDQLIQQYPQLCRRHLD